MAKVFTHSDSDRVETPYQAMTTMKHLSLENDVVCCLQLARSTRKALQDRGVWSNPHRLGVSRSNSRDKPGETGNQERCGGTSGSRRLESTMHPTASGHESLPTKQVQILLAPLKCVIRTPSATVGDHWEPDVLGRTCPLTSVITSVWNGGGRRPEPATAKYKRTGIFSSGGAKEMETMTATFEVRTKTRRVAKRRDPCLAAPWPVRLRHDGFVCIAAEAVKQPETVEEASRGGPANLLSDRL